MGEGPLQFDGTSQRRSGGSDWGLAVVPGTGRSIEIKIKVVIVVVAAAIVVVVVEVGRLSEPLVKGGEEGKQIRRRRGFRRRRGGRRRRRWRRRRNRKHRQTDAAHSRGRRGVGNGVRLGDVLAT